jgi:hypothetical protein
MLIKCKPGLAWASTAAVDQAIGLWRRGSGQHDVVAAGEQSVEVGHAFDTRRRNGLIRATCGDHFQPQGLGARGQSFADRAEADQAQR